MKAFECLGLNSQLSDWGYALTLIAKLEKLSGAKVEFLTKYRKLCGFSLVANDKVLVSVEYDSSECPSDAIDRLGGLFITLLMLQGAEA